MVSPALSSPKETWLEAKSTTAERIDWENFMVDKVFCFRELFQRKGWKGNFYELIDFSSDVGLCENERRKTNEESTISVVRA